MDGVCHAYNEEKREVGPVRKGASWAVVLLLVIGLAMGCSQPKHPLVTMTLADGTAVQIELYPDVAPNTVANFVNLAQAGFYNGLTFHRAQSDVFLQGGDPLGTGMGGPGYTIPGEFAANGFENNLKHEAGVISMARSQVYDSAGSQFFIMVGAAPSLDGQYAAFGKVVNPEGLEAIRALSELPQSPTTGLLETPPIIQSVTVETYGQTYTVEKAAQE